MNSASWCFLYYAIYYIITNHHHKWWMDHREFAMVTTELVSWPSLPVSWLIRPRLVGEGSCTICTGDQWAKADGKFSPYTHVLFDTLIFGLARLALALLKQRFLVQKIQKRHGLKCCWNDLLGHFKMFPWYFMISYDISILTNKFSPSLGSHMEHHSAKVLSLCSPLFFFLVSIE